MIWGKLLKASKSQFFDLWNETSDTYLRRLLWGLNAFDNAFPMSSVGPGIHSCSYFIIPFTACSVFACQIRTAQVFVHSAFPGSEVTCQSTMAYDPSGHRVRRWRLGDSGELHRSQWWHRQLLVPLQPRVSFTGSVKDPDVSWVPRRCGGRHSILWGEKLNFHLFGEAEGAWSKGGELGWIR